MQSYESPEDTFYFAKFDAISEDDAKHIATEMMNLSNKSFSSFSSLQLRWLARVIYDCDFNFEKREFTSFNDTTLFAKISCDITKSAGKNKREIVSMKKTNEEACVWLTRFMYSTNRCIKTASIIRDQISWPKYYNRLLFAYDVFADVLSMVQFKKLTFSSLKKIFKHYEEILMADPVIKYLDDDVQKIQEIIVYQVIKVGRIINVLVNSNEENNYDRVLAVYMKSYYTFTHRKKEVAELLERIIALFNGYTGVYLAVHKKMLREDRQKASFLDVLNLMTESKDPGAVSKMITLIYENFDMVKTMSGTKMGCDILCNVLIILRAKQILSSAEKLLYTKLVVLSSGGITDNNHKDANFVVKLYESKMKCDECFICLEQNKPERTLILECRKCTSIICCKCAAGIVKISRHNSKCPICRTPISGVARPLPFFAYMVPNFKYDLPAPRE